MKTLRALVVHQTVRRHFLIHAVGTLKQVPLSMNLLYQVRIRNGVICEFRLLRKVILKYNAS